MHGEEAFRAACQSAPDDDPARLVYTDWLDEQGDPRGEFIRVQAEMVRLPPYSAGYVDRKPRRAELRQQIDATWLRTMGYVPKHQPLFSRLPDRATERWRLVEEFIEVWHRPLEQGDGCSEEELADAESRLGLRLPRALRDWYRLAGKRSDVWSRQDSLPLPEQLRLDNESDTLVIRWENQACEKWGIRASDLGRDDPPIVEVGAGVESSPTTTAFAIQVMLCEAKFGENVVWAGGDVPENVFAPLLRTFPRCDLPDRYWVLTPIRFYEGTDLIIDTHADQWLYAAARTEAALEQLDEGIRSHLELYGGN
jgi:uncharacterized protein (TIGR02996 family)